MSQSSVPPPSPPAPEPSSAAASPVPSFDDIWTGVRGDDSIQYVPVPPDPPPDTEMPQWLKDIGQWFAESFEGWGDAIIKSWPLIEMFLIGLLVLGVLVLIWKYIWPLVRDYRRAENFETEWVPEQDAARQLLDEADALAARGEYDEAAHLLLYRSIEDIQRNRPHLLRPSNTTREIGRFDALSQGARDTFAIMAGHVERSLFARHALDAAAWAESRDAYGRFAFRGNWT